MLARSGAIVALILTLSGRLKPSGSRAIVAAMAIAFAAIAPASAQDQASGRKTISLTVEFAGDLPGFDTSDVPRYLISRMLDAGVEGWAFAPAQDSTSHAANRVEWRFHLNPYAGGSVRQIVPIPAVRRLFGARYLVSVEVRLYLNGEYQTQTFGQAAIQGGDRDPELANFVMQQTENLLGLNSAFRSIDMGPAPNKNSQSQRNQ
jgi:hypothetical protein